MADGDRDVLKSLPRTRPQRRSSRRESKPAAYDGAEPGKGRNATVGATAKPKARKSASARAGFKPKGGAAVSAQTKAGAKPKSRAAASAPPETRAKPKGRAATSAHAKTGTKAKARAGAAARRRRTRDSSVPVHDVPAAGYAVPRGGSPVTPGSGELVGTAAQALGELVQIGASFGGRTVRDALKRLPRP